MWLKVEKGLKDTGWPWGTQQRVNAAGDTVGGGKGRTGVIGKQIEGHEEPLAWGRDGNGGHTWKRAVPPAEHDRVSPHRPCHKVGSRRLTGIPEIEAD